MRVFISIGHYITNLIFVMLFFGSEKLPTKHLWQQKEGLALNQGRRKKGGLFLLINFLLLI
jgi:uncharacterized membrane protein